MSAPPENGSEDFDDLEQQLRRTLHSDPEHIDTEAFLSQVHRGAHRRRNRRVVAGSDAAVSVIAIGAYGVVASGALDHQPTPGASSAASSDVSTSSADETLSTRRTPVTAPNLPTSTVPSSTPSTHAGGAVEGGDFLSLSATGTLHQYVLLTHQGGRCPAGGCVEVDTTQDAGKTWEGTARLDVVPAIPDPSADSVNEVRFAGDGTDGWVYGGAIRSTHDGGQTWVAPTLPVVGTVTDLEAWGDNVYASVYDDPSATTTLVRSPIGADAWQTVDLGASPTVTSSLLVSQRLAAVLASPNPLSKGNELLTSTDGRVWTQRAVCAAGQYPSDLSTTGESLWVVCSGPQTAHARVSKDDGGSWTDVPGEFSPGSLVAARDTRTAVIADAYQPGLTIVAVHAQPARVTADNLTDVIPIGFTNPSTGYLKNSVGQVLRTADGGATWQRYPMP